MCTIKSEGHCVIVSLKSCWTFLLCYESCVIRWHILHLLPLVPAPVLVFVSRPDPRPLKVKIHD